MTAEPMPPVVTPLTDVEHEILRLLAEGLTVCAIAHQVHRGSSRVTAIAATIRTKLGASNTPHAVHLAHQRGLLS